MTLAVDACSTIVSPRRQLDAVICQSLLVVVLAASVTACAGTSVLPVSQNVIMVSASAAPICGKQGAQRVALTEAAAETVRRGYDKFIVVGGQSENNVRVVGRTPMTSQTDISGNRIGSTFSATASTTYSGGTPIIGGTRDQDLVIQMYRSGEPGSETAIDARATLGPRWQEAVARPGMTCF